MSPSQAFLSFSFIILLCKFQKERVECSQIILKKFEMCDPNVDYEISFNESSEIRNNIQYVTISALLKTPLGQNQNLNLNMEYSPNAKNYISLFKLNRKNLCDFFNKDLGPFWFELQKLIAVPPRTCPIKIGRYNVKNLQLPYSKFSLPYPTGFVRSVMYIFENGSNKTISCVLFLVEIM